MEKIKKLECYETRHQRGNIDHPTRQEYLAKINEIIDVVNYLIEKLEEN